MYVFNVVCEGCILKDVYADYAESAEKMAEQEGFTVLFAELA